MAPQFTRRPLRRPKDRAGRTTLVVVGVLATVAAGWIAWNWFKPKASQALPLRPHRVARGAFVHEVTERGEVESSNNIEVRCEVKTKTGTGSIIKWLIPEGTVVSAGEKLVEFDDTALQDELIQQQIVCNNSTAAMNQSDFALQTAETALEEYREGTYKQEVELVESEIALAEENLRRARQYLAHSKKLAAKGYTTPLQLKADEFAVTKAQGDLKAAQTKLSVLQRFTFRKMVNELQANVETAKVKLDSDKKTLELDRRKLAWIEEQITHCTVLAPVEGQVVYANPTDRRNNNEPLIQEGTSIRERQAVIRLPDPSKMQVKAKVNESRIDLVKAGMRATVRLDAMPEKELTGIVTKVDDYPIPSQFFSSNVKEYATLVQVESPPEGMRAGMTAEVKVHLEHQADVVQTPVQSVFEHAHKNFCLVVREGRLEAREVSIGSSNDKFLVVHSGLNEGEDVVMNPRAYLEEKSVRSQLPEERAGSQTPPERFARAPIEGKPPEERRPPRGPGGNGGANPQQIAAMILKRADKNGDGALTAEEFPPEQAAQFGQADANKDGKVDLQELVQGMARMMSAMGGGPPGLGGG